jgi:hypothetical protein
LFCMQILLDIVGHSNLLYVKLKAYGPLFLRYDKPTPTLRYTNTISKHNTLPKMPVFSRNAATTSEYMKFKTSRLPKPHWCDHYRASDLSVCTPAIVCIPSNPLIFFQTGSSLILEGEHQLWIEKFCREYDWYGKGKLPGKITITKMALQLLEEIGGCPRIDNKCYKIAERIGVSILMFASHRQTSLTLSFF